MLETERLLLRKPQEGDVEAACAMWGDPLVTRHISGSPLPRRQAWTALLAVTGSWEIYGYGGWTVIEKASGAFIGQIGFQRFVRGIDPTREHLPEAGWVLVPSAHGRGLATEAVAAILAWADANLADAHTVAIVNEGNVGSIRVAEKSGYREVLRAHYLEKPIVLFERPRLSPPA